MLTRTKRAPDASSSSHASDDTPVTLMDPTEQNAILQAIGNLKMELLAKIEEKAESQSAMIGSQVDQLREDLKRANETAKADSVALGKRITSIEQATTDHLEDIAALQHEMTEMKKQVATLKARNEDLEARSRRCDLRITGIRE